jgi:hypothetical protein
MQTFRTTISDRNVLYWSHASRIGLDYRALVFGRLLSFGCSPAASYSGDGAVAEPVEEVAGRSFTTTAVASLGSS